MIRADNTCDLNIRALREKRMMLVTWSKLLQRDSLRISHKNVQCGLPMPVATGPPSMGSSVVSTSSANGDVLPFQLRCAHIDRCQTAACILRI